MSSFEAQQLVALSLGKIAASRATRSGINLHKSLLVSTVLYKARTAILVDKYRASQVDFSDNDSSEESDFSEDQSLECNESSAPADITDQSPTTEQTQDNTETCQDSTNSSGEDKENTNSSCQFGFGITRSDNKSCVLGSTENLSVDSQQDNEGEISKCERCTKRRLSSVDENSSPVKRLRQDENPLLGNEEKSEQHQPMDQGQMTHLVDSFNSGFDSLLNNSSNCVSQQVQTGNNGFSDIGISPKSQVQGLSEAFGYCSTQIKESFDTLTSPIIALTV